MDGECSRESDLSESWSLIDINLNEESVTAIDALSVFHPSPDLESKKLKKNENLEFDSVETNFEENKTSSCRLIKSDLISDDQKSCSNKPNFVEISDRRASDDGSKNDSCDTESIEILELDGNYRDTEIDKLDILFISKSNGDDTYQSDNEKLFDEEIFNKEILNSDELRKPKRRKLNEQSKYLYNNENSKITMEQRKSNEESNYCVQETFSYRLCKYYWNNIANIGVSLSVSVIIAGLACIAIGNFLGVHDARKTANELMENLKKLQMENVALQSKLSLLNRAITETDLKTKLVQDSLKQEKLCDYGLESLKSSRTDSYIPSQPEVYPSGHLVKWLSKLESLLRNRDKYSDIHSKINLNKIEAYIHDQLIFLKSKAEEDARILENSEKNISKILQKMVEKLSSNQDNIEMLYRKLLILKDKLNKKLNEIFPEKSFGHWKEYAGASIKKKDRAIVTEQDLLSLQWYPNVKKSSNGNSSEKLALPYKFPQPEEYYGKNNERSREHRKNITGKDAAEINSSETESSTLKAFGNMNFIGKKRGEKTDGSWKNKNKQKNEKKEKRKKGGKGKTHKEKFTKKLPEKGNKKRKEPEKNKSEQFFVKKNRRGWSKTKFLKKNSFKDDFESSKNILKAFTFKESFRQKGSNGDRGFVSNFPKNGKYLLDDGQVCSSIKSGDHETLCLNLTGDWVFKWARGRQESRRHHSLGDWQFERARARRQQRLEDSALNWQLRRALARESDRNEDRWYYHPYRIRTPDRNQRDEFSWI